MTPINHCFNWIVKFITPIQTINRTRSSYNLKHEVEQWCGEYVPMEAFIDAADELGYKKRRIADNSPNFFFDMSFKKIPKRIHSRDITPPPPNPAGEVA